jgi:hypothetical protein
MFLLPTYHSVNYIPLGLVEVKSWWPREDLKDGWTGNDLGVIEGTLNIRLGDKDVGLTTETRWDGSGDLVACEFISGYV